MKRREFCWVLGATGSSFLLPNVGWGTVGQSHALTTFRGGPDRSIQGFGPVPRKPVVKWSFKTEVHVESLGRGSRSWTGTGWSGQCAVSDGRVYIPGLDGHCYCRDIETGAEIWRYAAGDSIKGSITLWDDLVLFGSRDNHLHAVHRHSGLPAWTLHCGSKDVDSTPAVLGEYAWFGAEDTHLYCVDRQGVVLWKQATGGSIESSPAVSSGRVLIGSYDGYLHCFRADDGHLCWKFPTGDDTDSSPVVIGERVFIGCENGFIYCIDLASGSRIWRYRAAAGIWGTPAVVDGAVYIGDDAGILHCVAAKTGIRLWMSELGSGTWASPTVVDGVVVIGDWAGTLHGLDARNGDVLWQRTHKDTYIVSSAAIIDGLIIIGVRDGTVYCLQESKGGLQ